MRQGHVHTFRDVPQQLNRVLKPDKMDIPQVLPQQLALTETLTDIAKGKV